MSDKLNFDKGAIPLYLQIKDIIKKKIINLEYQNHQLIPSELELSKYFKVSRITVRQAIGDLEKEGFVKRGRGIGTEVTYSEKINENLGKIRSFSKEMADRNMIAGTKKCNVVIEEANQEISEKLQIPLHSSVYHVTRIKTANNEPLVVFETYLPNNVELPLNPQEYEESIYELLEKKNIHTPVLVNESYEAMLATTQLAKQLNIKEKMAIFKRVRVGYNIDNQPIEYTISYYRGDKYTYSIQLKGGR